MTRSMMAADGNLNLLVIYSSLMMTGLAASLHCVGMCGPILLSFAEVFHRTPLTINGQKSPRHNRTPRSRSLAWDFTCYHSGRIWTYAMLGFGAGLFGQGIRSSSTIVGWQFPMAIAISATVIISGVLLLGIVPIKKIDGWLAGCGAGELTRKKWLVKLICHRGWLARLLLGVVMGLLPCGMVYAVLLVVAALPSPLHSAMGMVTFGLGTLPSLTAVLLAPRLVPSQYRAYGSRLVAVMIILAGAWMMARTLIVWPAPSGDDGQYPSCHSTILNPFDNPPHGTHAQAKD